MSWEWLALKEEEVAVGRVAYKSYLRVSSWVDLGGQGSSTVFVVHSSQLPEGLEGAAEKK